MNIKNNKVFYGASLVFGLTILYLFVGLPKPSHEGGDLAIAAAAFFVLIVTFISGIVMVLSRPPAVPGIVPVEGFKIIQSFIAFCFFGLIGYGNFKSSPAPYNSVIPAVCLLFIGLLLYKIWRKK